MQRYFNNNLINNMFTLDSNDTYHINTVMRMKLNEKIEVVSNNTLYICEITSLKPNVICKVIEEVKDHNFRKPHITLLQSLTKDSKLELIFQKTTELGIDEIILYKALRSIVKIDNFSKKSERWNKIIKEASEQSKRLSIPILNKIIDIKDIKDLDYDYKFICSVKENKKFLKEELQKCNISGRILFVVGPEGGFQPEEEQLFIDNGFIPVSLGNNVLRCETAPLFILSAINYEFMR